MQQKSIMTLTKDIRFEGYVLIRMSEQRTGSTGNKYLDLTLADCTGELNGKLWDGNVDPPPVGSVHQGTRHDAGIQRPASAAHRKNASASLIPTKWI